MEEARTTKNWGLVAHPGRGIAVALAYGALGLVTLVIQPDLPVSSYSSIGLSSGLAVVALYLWGVALIPAVLIPAVLLAIYSGGLNWQSLAVGLALTAGPVAGATLARRQVGGRDPRTNSSGFARWLWTCAGLGALTTAGLITLIHALSEKEFAPAALVAVFTIDAMAMAAGVLLIAPLVLFHPWPLLSWRWDRTAGRKALLLMAVAAATVFAFGFWVTTKANYPLAFLPLPVLIAVALKGGKRLACIGVALSVGLAWWASELGYGPFGIHAPWERALLLQSFAIVSALSTLILAVMSEERQVAEERLRLTASVFEDASDAIAISDANGQIVETNLAFRNVTGLSDKELEGRHLDELHFQPATADTSVTQKLWHQLRHQGHWKGEITQHSAEGLERPVACLFTSYTNRQGLITHYISYLRDVSERKFSEKQIYNLAHFDSLTGLPNRTLFSEHLDLALSFARRHRQEVAVIFLDLDQFKGVNDSLGHEAGDEVLRILGSRLRQEVRGTDTVARWGGDEFTVLLTEVTNANQVSRVVRKILDCLFEPVNIRGHSLVFGGSAGVALYPIDGVDGTNLLRNADAAMYVSKNSGRGSFRFYTHSMNAKTLQRLGMENDLRRALSGGEFRVYYQPLVSLPEGRLIGVEALARWQRPGHGLIEPVDFISLAEDTGLIVDLGRWVLEQACRQIVTWQDQYGHHHQLTVNLSARQLKDDRLPLYVQDILTRTGFQAQHLILEITESQLLEGQGQVHETLEKLRSLGVRFYIDDFGTGYSSLSQLKRLPVDGLKLDKSFVMDLVADSDASAIAWAVIEMGDHLGLKVVAEGVENQAQMEYLAGHHCKFAQGYFFSRPLPADAMGSLWRHDVTLPAAWST